MRNPGQIVTLTAAAAALFASTLAAIAGPPYLTDDPEPVDYRHWEVYISSIYMHGPFGSSGTLPHLEVNNGVAPNIQIHLIAPLAFASAPGMGTAHGIGDIELGAKWRFVPEGKDRPMVGIFPLLELPTGDSNQGLGTGYLHAFIPIWFQKSWGPWTTCGGGGYWINPGTGNRDYGQLGWLVQRDLNKRLTLGIEFYYLTPTYDGAPNEFNFNFGGQYNFDEGHHLLFSVGRSISGDTDLTAYVGYQWTFGPHENTEEKPAADDKKPDKPKADEHK